MKRLILMRHAKSSWADAGQRDHERPLNKRGRRAAGLIDAWLAEHAYLPQRAYVSTSARTRETWALMPKVSKAVEAEFLQELFGAGPETLMAVLRAAGAAECVLMLAHQPGIGAFAAQLVAERPEHPEFARYPTGATAILEFAADDWSGLAPGSGRLADFVVPRALEASSPAPD